MSIHVVKSGLQTSVQDNGRFAQMCNGIAVSGAMDSTAMQLANYLVSNPLNHPVLEITLTGPVIEFTQATSIAIVGAEFDLFLNGNLVFNEETIKVKSGDLLEFGRLNEGARAYLAIAADFNLQRLFDSSSTNLTAHFGGCLLTDNSQLQLQNYRQPPDKQLPPTFHLSFSGNYLLRCVDSVETHWFDQTTLEQFTQKKYQVQADSNRMGIRLQETGLSTAILPDKQQQVISSGLVCGSIQIPPSANPIIAGVDAQTIGGYPRIANVASVDLPILGQLKPNDKLSFYFIEQSQAVTLIRYKQKLLSQLFNNA
ncbi:biotin-dependent carboxyltransferase family protein [Aliikangiella maris]|uniref:Biotin-dependent carboxyltransferase family protein n=2 Tax=Aliikangiella maris TaxID=3162458 RepID=A0ABV2BPY1_9GAMM